MSSGNNAATPAPYKAQARSRNASVGWDTSHINELGYAVARRMARNLNGTSVVLQLDNRAVATAVETQAEQLATLFSYRPSPGLQYVDVIDGLMEEMLPLQSTLTSGNGGTVRRFLAGPKSPTATKSTTVPNAVVLAMSAAVQVGVTGFNSGLPVNTHTPTPGIDGVLSSTAVWNGAFCHIHTTVNLSDEQMRLIAAFNLQGTAIGKQDDADYMEMVYRSTIL